MISKTFFIDGIESNERKIPSFLVKAMERQFAEALIYGGEIRLNSVDYYQKLENEELGDRLEGLGELVFSNHPYSISSGNPVFIWCSALPDSDFDTLLNLDKKYDSIIRINDPLEFSLRIFSALSKIYKIAPPHVGMVNYNRSVEVDKNTLNSQPWHWNLFQKRLIYSHQNEYRFTFTDLSYKADSRKPLDINIGNCEDIGLILET